MLSHKKEQYCQLVQRNSDDERVVSKAIKDFGGNRYDHSADLRFPNTRGNNLIFTLRRLLLSCLYATLLATFVMITVTAIIYANWFTRDFNTRSSISWSREFDYQLTELSVETSDVNGDGVLDIFTSGTSGSCMSVLRALDGLSGDVLFETKLGFDAFALNCNADLNLDGHSDCLASGRFGGFAAIHGQNGTLLWYVDSSIVFPRYGFYFPLLVRDLDGDGIMDVINTHGGDTIYAPSDRNRSTGFFIVVSGRTGGKLMDRIPVPDGKETYSSPVLHVLPDGREMVLFGTGGETIEGSLWGVSLDSIQKNVQKYQQISHQLYHPVVTFINPYCTKSNTNATEAMRPVYNASMYNFDTENVDCVPWGQAKHIWTSFGLCVYQVLVSKQKGIMLPLLLVDMNNDKHLDLVVSTFGGHTTVLDGRSLILIWDKHFPNSESYSVPCPMFFNNDNVPDLLVRINFGTWNVYQYSDIMVLDGSSGEVMWAMRSTNAVMSSPVSFHAHSQGNDAALFVTLGQSRKVDTHAHTSRDADYSDYIRNCLEGTSKSCSDFESTARAIRDEGYIDVLSDSNLWKGNDFPNPQSNLEAFLRYCNVSNDLLSSKLYFIVPKMILTDQVQPLDSFSPYVDVTIHKRDSQHESAVKLGMPSPQTSRCMHILRPDMLLATPALSDLDGDGEVEVVVVTSWAAFRPSPTFKYEVKVFTLRQKAEQIFSSSLVDFSQFLPISQQPWTKYMGTTGMGVCKY